MKKALLFLALASLFVLFSCSGVPGAYSIKGESSLLSDGDSVFIVNNAGRTAEYLDTAVVSAGKFAFSGVKEKPQVCQIKAGELKLRGFFFFEEGDMKLVIPDSTSYKVTGTADNEIYNCAEDSLASLRKALSGVYRGYFSEKTTDEQRAQMVRRHDSINVALYAAIKDIAAANMTNPVGQYYLRNNYSHFSPEDVYALVQALPEEAYNDDERMLHIRDYAFARYATRVGEKFTDITLAAPDGTSASLSDYAGKGKYVLVDFWASWCGPCCREMPNVVELYKKYKASGMFEVVGVSLDDETDSWTKAIDKLGITWPQMSDLKGWDCAGADAYGVNAIPYTVLIDPQGIIIATDLRSERLAAMLAEYIK